VRSAFTWEPGTWIEEEDQEVEQAVVSAVTSEASEAKVTVAGVPDHPGVAARLFRALADRSVNVDMIEQNVSVAGTTDISFTVPREDLEAACDVATALQGGIGAAEVLSDPGIATVSIIGAGMKTHPGISATMFETLASEGINIEMISTSSIRLTCVVRADLVERAVVALHRAFGLEGEQGRQGW
jgi:aspartate kinase